MNTHAGVRLCLHDVVEIQFNRISELRSFSIAMTTEQRENSTHENAMKMYRIEIENWFFTLKCTPTTSKRKTYKKQLCAEQSRKKDENWETKKSNNNKENTHTPNNTNRSSPVDSLKSSSFRQTKCKLMFSCKCVCVCERPLKLNRNWKCFFFKSPKRSTTRKTKQDQKDTIYERMKPVFPLAHLMLRALYWAKHEEFVFGLKTTIQKSFIANWFYCMNFRKLHFTHTNRHTRARALAYARIQSHPLAMME